MRKLYTTKKMIQRSVLFCLIFFPAQIRAQANVYVNPSSMLLSGQSSVTIDFMISNVSDLHAYSVKILYDNSILSLQSAIKGPFLSTGGSTLFSTRPVPIIDSVEVDEAILGTNTVNGSGKLFSITFNVLSAGSSLINIVAVQLRDHNNLPIPVTWASGEVVVPLSVNAKLFLQGPFNLTNMNTTLNSFDYLPLFQPYSGPPWNYDGSESVSSGFFNTHPNIVDWILVELRKGTSLSTAVERRAGFLINTGNIVGLDGSSPIYFLQQTAGYYVVIYHRNHISIMSSNSILLNYVSTQYDFTTAQSKVYGMNAMVQLASNIFGMYSADANGDGSINATDLNAYWIPQNGTPYNYNTKTADFNLDGTINATDLNNYWILNNGKATQVPN